MSNTLYKMNSKQFVGMGQNEKITSVSFSHIVDEKHSTINTEVVLQCAITFMIVVLLCYVVSYTLASSGSNPTWLLMTIFIV